MSSGKHFRLIVFVCAIHWFFEASAACSGYVTIAELAPREEGWIHVIAAGGINMDLNSCGATGPYGLLINLNDVAAGSMEGKKILWATLLSAQASGKSLNLCSTRCDSQHSAYSSLTSVN